MSSESKRAPSMSKFVNRSSVWRLVWLFFWLNIAIAAIFSVVLFVYRMDQLMPINNIFRYLVLMGSRVWEYLRLEYIYQLPVLANFMVPLAVAELLCLIGFARGNRRGAERRMWPLAALTKAAGDVRKDPLHTRLPLLGGARETAELAGAVNQVLDEAAAIHVAYGHQARFVSDASHELRTPIAVIQGYVNMMERWAKDDPAALQESIEALKNEADGMQQLIEQLLFLSRGEQGAIPMQSAPVNASQLAADVCGEAAMIDEKHVYKHDTPEFCYVLGDAGLLKQALRVLVDNARKYTPEGGEITLSCKQEDGKVRICVEDTGIGIDGADVPRIFDRFFRADESRARKTGGSGLGLSIAKWIIDRHYGIIEVLSRKGLGTRITFLLPECKNPVSKQYI
ncbi:MAG: HAMP domain-containing histidine kinase [Oscillospiraceae bacterium]|nr:HAMP domain-containing histidine kinase [Oscillospiraceae bacterium]